jgi:hypothetical protein
LAQTFVGPDREQLLEFAAEIEKEADALEAAQISISLPPVAEPRAAQQGGVQQPQLGKAPPLT